MKTAVGATARRHALGVGSVRPGIRGVAWHGCPEITRYTRQRRPHTGAGKFWLCNRLPEQWSYQRWGRATPVARSSLASTKTHHWSGAPPATMNPAHLFPAPPPVLEPVGEKWVVREAASIKIYDVGSLE